MKSCTFWLFLIVILVGGGAYCIPLSNCYIAGDSSEVNYSNIESLGGRVIHYFPPNEYLCHFQPSLLQKAVSVMTASGVKVLSLTDDNSSLSTYSVENGGYGLMCFMAGRGFSTEELSPSRIAPDPGDTMPFQCSFHHEEGGSSAAASSSIMRPSLANMNTSEYLIGRIAVCVMLMESTGPMENWTTSKENTSILNAFEACDELSAQALAYNVPLTWVYEIHTQVSTPEEPIMTYYPYWGGLPPQWIFGWIDDAWEALGVGEEWDGSYANANRMRRQYGADYGLTLFIVMNQTVPTFPTGANGYSQSWSESLGERWQAPFAVATHYRGEGTATYSDRVFAHEMLHVFGASDEYSDAPGCSSEDNCSDEYGFLHHDNLNCAHCGSQDDCIMLSVGYGYRFCAHSRYHIGWVDSDGDGAPTPIDPNAESWFTIGPVITGDLAKIYTVSGSAVRTISVTDDKRGVYPGGGGILFDCQNYGGGEIAPGIYYWTVNDGPPHTTTLFQAESPSLTVNSIAYSNDTLRWEMPNSFAYLTLEILAVDRWHNDDTFLLAKPQWNKFHFSSVDMPHKKQAMTGIECNPCRARFMLWLPMGNVGPTVEYSFDTYQCGDFDGVPGVDIGDVDWLIAFLFSDGLPPSPMVAADVDCTNNVDMGDLTALIDNLFISFSPLMCCW